MHTDTHTEHRFVYGCRVGWSARRLAKRCKPFEVSCLVAGGVGCVGSRRRTGVFVILLAVRSPGGAAV